MNAEIEAISLDRLRGLIADDPRAGVILEFSRNADPLLMARLGETILGFVGFIPATVLSDTAYVWVHVTDAGRAHKQSIGRLALRFRPIVRARYRRLSAHCLAGCPEHLAWLRFIGAEIVREQDGAIQYLIEV